MRPATLALLYGLIGLAVSLAWRARRGPGAGAALVLWPFLLPALFAGHSAPPMSGGPVGDACQELARALGALGPPHASRCASTLASAARGLRRIEARLETIEALRPRIEGLAEGPARVASMRRLQDEEDAARGQLRAGLEALSALTARVHLARITGEDPLAVAARLRELTGDIDAATEIESVGNGRVRSA